MDFAVSENGPAALLVHLDIWTWWSSDHQTATLHRRNSIHLHKSYMTLCMLQVFLLTDLLACEVVKRIGFVLSSAFSNERVKR